MEHPDGREPPEANHVDGDRCRHASAFEHAPGPDHAPSLGRRRLLALGGGVAAASLAGCLGGGTGSAPDPVGLSGGLQCDECGMVIEMHPGPNGQIFYRDRSPEGHENPARFDSLKSCLFPYKLAHERLDWEAAAVYVTDYSAVDYELGEEGGTTYVSSHVAADAFASAADLVYVVESEVEGAMGPDFLPFSDDGEADAFAADHGGQVVAYDEIDEGLIGR